MRLLVAVVLVVPALAACAAAVPSSSPAGPAATAAPEVACEAPPEPEPLASPGASGTATRHPIVLAESTGSPDPLNGSVRLCLGDGRGVSLAGPATCAWLADRSRYAYVSASLQLDGHPTQVTVDLDPTLPRTVSLSRAGGDYRAGGPDEVVAVADDGLSGVAGPVRLAFQPPLDGAAVPIGGAAETVLAVVRWQCLPPQPPDPGVARGELRFRIDAPVDAELATRASCTWDAPDGRLQVAEISGFSERVRIAPGVFVAVAVRPDPDGGTVELYGTLPSHQRRGDYGLTQASRIVVLDERPDRATGRLRVRGLEVVEAAPDESTTLDGTDATRTIGLDLSWRCDRPAVGPAAGHDAPVLRAERSGSIRFALRGPVEAVVEAPATCVVEPSGVGDGTYATAVRADLELAGETWRIDAGMQAFTILRLAPDGAIVGEYERDWSVWGNNVDDVVLRDTFVGMGVPEGGIAPAPLGDEPHPAWLSLSFQLDCRPR